MSFFVSKADQTVQATATVSTAAGATDVVLGTPIVNLALHPGMNNFKTTLPSGFLPAASFLRVRWDNFGSFGSTADFFVNQAGQCPTLQDLQPPTMSQVRERSLLTTYWSESTYSSKLVDRPCATGVWIPFSR